MTRFYKKGINIGSMFTAKNKKTKMEKKNIDNKEEQVNKEENETKKETTETQDKNKEEKDQETKQEEKKETPEDKIEALGNKLNEVNDKYLRLYSEFENYRKRVSKERIELISNASEDVIKDLLPVVDDYQRAIDAIEKIEDDQVKKTLEGLSLIYKKLYSILEKRGLKPIDAKGKPFDENLHEAIAQLPAQSEEDKGKVIDETTKGYYLNNKVIRFSKVVVAI